MSRVVHKQVLTLAYEQEFDWPLGARVVHSAVQENKPVVWFEFSTTLKDQRVIRRFSLADTGEYVEENAEHRATFLLDGGLDVRHLFQMPADGRVPG